MEPLRCVLECSISFLRCQYLPLTPFADKSCANSRLYTSSCVSHSSTNLCG